MKAALLSALLALCVGLPAAGSQDWCYGTGDNICAWVEGSTITVDHWGAFYNCGCDSITSAWTQEGNLFRVHETAYNGDAICFCCWYLGTSMREVPAGHYQIDFIWYDVESQQDRHAWFDVFVPDVGQSGGPVAGGSDNLGCGEPPTGVPENLPAKQPVLYPARPNPLPGVGVIRFDLPVEAWTTLAIFTVAGVRVRTLLDENGQPGAHAILWDGRDDSGRRLPGGLYFCRLSAGRTQAQRRLVLLQ